MAYSIQEKDARRMFDAKRFLMAIIRRVTPRATVPP
jgi:hypothetical protein